MNVYFDTEFTGLHNGTSLISIGLVSDDGKQFYAELTDYNNADVDDWIKKNVIDNLISHTDDETRPFVEGYHIGTRDNISFALKNWLSQWGTVELVSDCCHYDMVLFVDLFGTAWNLPENVAPVCYDINQDIARHWGITQQRAFDQNREDLLDNNLNIGDLPKHNALHDAYVIRELYHMMNGVPGEIK